MSIWDQEISSDSQKAGAWLRNDAGTHGDEQIKATRQLQMLEIIEAKLHFCLCSVQFVLLDPGEHSWIFKEWSNFLVVIHIGHIWKNHRGLQVPVTARVQNPFCLGNALHFLEEWKMKILQALVDLEQFGQTSRWQLCLGCLGLGLGRFFWSPWPLTAEGLHGGPWR